MSEIARGQAEAGTMIDGEREEWAFDLNEFFAVNENGHFLHNVDVDRFLDALTTQKKYPFSTPELRDELNCGRRASEAACGRAFRGAGPCRGIRS